MTDTTTYRKGDRVRSLRWGGYVGTVKSLFDDGDVEVRWDGAHFTDDRVSPEDIEKVGGQ